MANKLYSFEVLNNLGALLGDVTIACIQYQDGFEQEQIEALLVAYRAFNPVGGVRSGQEAEDAYHDAYQARWKLSMATSEDSEGWNSGNFEWPNTEFYPVKVLRYVAGQCANYDAEQTKDWLRWCRGKSGRGRLYRLVHFRLVRLVRLVHQFFQGTPYDD